MALELRGFPVMLVDTAGIRETDDPIEREGVARARRRAEEADLTLWLTDAGAPIAAPFAGGRPVLAVLTKADRRRGPMGRAPTARDPNFRADRRGNSAIA